MEKERRLWLFDLLKIIFTVIVVIGHSRYISKRILFPSGGGYAVEFFFTLSGFMLVKSYEKRLGKGNNDSFEAYNYTKRRLLYFAPGYVISFVLVYAGLFISEILQNGFVSSFKVLPKRSFIAILELLGLQMFGFCDSVINGPTWYLSAMLICGMIIFFLLCSCYKTTKYVVAPVGGLLLLGFGYNHLNEFLAWEIYPFGLVRAMSCMLLGVFAYVISEEVDNSKMILEIGNNIGKTIRCSIEITGWIILVLIAITCESYDKSFFVFEIICVLWVGITGSNYSIQKTKVMSNKIEKVSKYMFSLYMTHFFALYIVRIVNQGRGYFDGIGLYIVFAIIVAAIEYILENGYKMKRKKV